MNRRLIRYAIAGFAYLVVLYPLWVRYNSISWSFSLDTIIYNIFPGLGLTAFAILWLHAISGVFEPWLRKYFDFDLYVRNTSIVILASIILHPLLFLVMSDFNFGRIF